MKYVTDNRCQAMESNLDRFSGDDQSLGMGFAEEVWMMQPADAESAVWG